ncbi:hypothetical protein PCO82_05200 [Pectobacteriaceae bacterium CE90]|nr:hypothetical protein PCO82_05200 [Pectobacteriaceae bacterium CE90]
MKTSAALLVIFMLNLLPPAVVIAAPGPGGPGQAPIPAHRHEPGVYVDHLPPGVETALIAGLTYYVLNGIFYQQEHGRYIIVTPPPAANALSHGGLTVLDINGERFYVKDGTYYKRTINGEYIEVPKPAGL